jgi:cyclopropane-fatty-acyl-phospholipid synthase
MTDTIIPRRRSLTADVPSAVFRTLARKAVFASLANLRHGVVTVIEDGREHRFGAFSERCRLSVTLEVKSPRLWSAVMLEGSTGAGEAYIHGDWACDDLTAFFRILIANRGVLENLETGAARIGAAVLRGAYRMRRNTREGSRRNIEAHYDLGNDFYQLFLDPTMTYSSGIFEREDSTLEEASIAKMDRLCRRLQIRPEHHLLEIGTGWGSMAIHAAKHYGCRVTTTTISNEQHAWAVNAVREAGLADRVRVLKRDYRDLRGRYDRLVSVEMIEAVGAEFYGTFMQTCARLLKPDGAMAMQAITIRDQHFDRARREVELIKRFVFPGSCIPSVNSLLTAAAKSSDMVLTSLDDFGPHYARTLATWRERFFARLDDVKALGYSDEFVRLWDYYLTYCEAGFAERHIGVSQMVLARPQCRMTPRLPELP